MRSSITAVLLLSCVSVFAQGKINDLQKQAEWDFTKSKLSSDNGKYPLNLRGSTKIGDSQGIKALRIGMSQKAEGAQLQTLAPELCPNGALRYEFTIRMREPDSKTTNLILFDSKYSFYQPREHNGVAFLLSRSPKNHELYRMTVYAGLVCGRSESFYSNQFLLKENEIHTVAYEFDGKDTFSFFLDGKLISRQTRKNCGPLAAPANFKGVIGDRYNSGYCHFQGDIMNVKIFTEKGK